MPMSTKIVLDTNFLLIPGQFGVDIFSEIRRITDFRYQLVIVEKSLEELKKLLKQGKRADKTAANLAISLLKTQNIKILRLHSQKKASADDDIAALAGNDVMVATQDRILQMRVRKKGAKIISLRKKSHLIIDK